LERFYRTYAFEGAHVALELELLVAANGTGHTRDVRRVSRGIAKGAAIRGTTGILCAVNAHQHDADVEHRQFDGIGRRGAHKLRTWSFGGHEKWTKKEEKKEDARCAISHPFDEDMKMKAEWRDAQRETRKTVLG
jgi:hypothetical protein